MTTAEQIATLLTTEPTTRDRIGEPYPFRNEKRREVTSQWRFGAGHTDPDNTQYGDAGTIVLDLTTYHHGNVKQYGTTLRVSIESEDGRMVQTTIAFGARGEAVKILNAPCARFSAKTMREHHAAALARVQELTQECGEQLAPGVEQYLPTPVA